MRHSKHSGMYESDTPHRTLTDLISAEDTGQISVMLHGFGYQMDHRTAVADVYSRMTRHSIDRLALVACDAFNPDTLENMRHLREMLGDAAQMIAVADFVPGAFDVLMRNAGCDVVSGPLTLYCDLEDILRLAQTPPPERRPPEIQ